MDFPEACHNRTRLPESRSSITHTAKIGRGILTFTVGLYENRHIGEVFINELTGTDVPPALMGSLDCFATALSILIQSHYPIQLLVKKFIETTFEPNGFTDNPEIRSCKSIIDYMVKWIWRYEDGLQKQEKKII